MDYNHYNSRKVYNQPFPTQSSYNSRTIYDPMIMNPDQASSSSNNPSTLHPTSLHPLSPTSNTSSNNSMYLTTTINTDDNNLSEKDIAKRVHSSLYSKRKDIQNNVIRHFYDANAVFENPLLLVETHEDIINQFILLSTFFQSIKPEVHSITDSAVTGGHHIVVIDAVIKYRFPIRLPPIPCPLFICNFLPFGWHRTHHSSMFHCSNNEIALRIISRFEFNEQTKIVRHEDMWSIKDLFESLPLVGWIYAEVSRKVNGMITGGIVVLVSELVKEWNEWHV
nr:6490_t:CDS:2 [Entrophospora candida]